MQNPCPCLQGNPSPTPPRALGSLPCSRVVRRGLPLFPFVGAGISSRAPATSPTHPPYLCSSQGPVYAAFWSGDKTISILGYVYTFFYAAWMGISDVSSTNLGRPWCVQSHDVDLRREAGADWSVDRRC